jgi:acetyl-CoA/propionyl-CoA carboxylase biotin carboxyl carrier protein
MAAMNPRGGTYRVADTSATRHDDDEPLTVDTSEPSGTRSRQRMTAGTVAPPDAAGRRTVEVVVDGWRFEFEVEDAARAALRERASRDRAVGLGGGGPLEIRAIIPGRIASVAVTAGDLVEAGQTMLAVEAMKMQNELRAPRAGTVSRVAVAAGATVELGDLLVVLG